MESYPFVLDWTEMPWEDTGPCCRTKRFVRGNQQLRLVKFQKGFEEDGWCDNAHVGFVLRGELTIQFPGQTVSAHGGDVVWIPAGYATRHRAHVVGESVQLVLFEDLTEKTHVEVASREPPDN